MTTDTEKPKGKRGPKFKPADQHHTPKLHKHAPDVAKILENIPKRLRARWVDEAIRQAAATLTLQTSEKEK